MMIRIIALPLFAGVTVCHGNTRLRKLEIQITGSDSNQIPEKYGHNTGDDPSQRTYDANILSQCVLSTKIDEDSCDGKHPYRDYFLKHNGREIGRLSSTKYRYMIKTGEKTCFIRLLANKCKFTFDSDDSLVEENRKIYGPKGVSGVGKSLMAACVLRMHAKGVRKFVLDATEMTGVHPYGMYYSLGFRAMSWRDSWTYFYQTKIQGEAGDAVTMCLESPELEKFLERFRVIGAQLVDWKYDGEKGWLPELGDGLHKLHQQL